MRMDLIDVASMRAISDKRCEVRVIAKTEQFLIVSPLGGEIQIPIGRRSGHEYNYTQYTGGTFWQIPDEDLFDHTAELGMKDIETRRMIEEACRKSMGPAEAHRIAQGAFMRGAYSHIKE